MAAPKPVKAEAGTPKAFFRYEAASLLPESVKNSIARYVDEFQRNINRKFEGQVFTADFGGEAIDTYLGVRTAAMADSDTVVYNVGADDSDLKEVILGELSAISAKLHNDMVEAVNGNGERYLNGVLRELQNYMDMNLVDEGSAATVNSDMDLFFANGRDSSRQVDVGVGSARKISLTRDVAYGWGKKISKVSESIPRDKLYANRLVMSSIYASTAARFPIGVRTASFTLFKVSFMFMLKTGESIEFLSLPIIDVAVPNQDDDIAGMPMTEVVKNLKKVNVNGVGPKYALSPELLVRTQAAKVVGSRSDDVKAMKTLKRINALIEKEPKLGEVYLAAMEDFTGKTPETRSASAAKRSARSARSAVAAKSA